jgi:hypothetical protein
MLYYVLTLECPDCRSPCSAALVAEGEPPPEAIFEIKCPSHGGPIPIGFGSFKPTKPFSPTAQALRHPPQRLLPAPFRRWWRLW